MRDPFVRPPRLKPGDLIGVTSLSGPADPALVADGCQALERLGYRTRVLPSTTRRSGPLGLAGSDRERLEGYRELLLDPDVGGIVFARGGYGALRLLPHLDPIEVRENPKVQCGFSDITAVHSFLLRRCGLVSFHGPMVASDLARPLDPLTASFFPSLLEGRGPRELALPDADVISGGSATGVLVGGCLAILVALLGSPDEFDYDGAILFLEDVGEEAYRIDRMLGTLQRAGRMDKLAAVLIGSFSRITFSGTEDPGRLRGLFSERLASMGIPVVAGVPVGHRGPNVPLPVGVRASWDGERRVLRFDEEAVR